MSTSTSSHSTSTSTSINPPLLNSVQLHSQPQPSIQSQSSIPISDTPEDPNPDLFWLPARLHPEIAPQEFKAFIQEATKPENLLRRTNSALGSRRRIQTEDDPVYPTSNSALGRKKSMLSKVYDPSSDSSASPSNRSSFNSETSSKNQINRGQSMSSRGGLGRGLEGLESLTINDLQRLESLVLNNDPTLNPSTPLVDSSEGNVAGFGLGESRITAVLRRSLSMGGAAALYSGNESSDDSSDPTDDSPLISRGPGHIIRRTARTKVRKTALAGDGNGHRFPATRRTKIVNNGSLNDQQSTPSTSLDSCTSEDSVGGSTIQSNQHLNPLTYEEKRVSNISSSTDEPSLEDGSLDESHSSHLHRSLSPGSKYTNTTSPTSICDSLTASSHDSKSNIQHSSTYPTLREINFSPTDDYLGATSLSPSARPVSTASNSSLLDAYADLSSPEDSLPTITTESIDSVPVPISRASYPPQPSINSTSKASQNASTHASFPYTSMSSSDHLPIGIPPNSHRTTRTSVPFPTLQPSSSTATPNQSNNENSAITSSSTSLNVPGIKDSKGKKTLTNTFTKSMDDLHARGAMSNDNSSRVETSTSSSSRPSNKQAKTSPPTLVSSTTSPPPSVKETKEKKRTWAKLGLSSSSSSDKSKKGKSKEKSTAAPIANNNTSISGSGSAKSGSKKEDSKKEASGSGSFLSGLFGGTKTKKTESSTSSSSNNNANNTSNVTKSITSPTKKVEEEISELNPTASGGFIKGRYTSFYRLPIHVERAVYRLSHIKLANPRRPLYEQVLISNLMFWYLGVINKTNVINQSQQPSSVQHQQQQQIQQSGSNHGLVGQVNNGNQVTSKNKNGKSIGIEIRRSGGGGIGEEGFEDETDSEEESSSEESTSESSSESEENQEEEEEIGSSSEGFESCEGGIVEGDERSGSSYSKKKKSKSKGNQLVSQTSKKNETVKVKRIPGGIPNGNSMKKDSLKKKSSMGWMSSNNGNGNGNSLQGSGSTGSSGNGKGKNKKS
ncbi:hypothetical protein DFH28DRAFT_923180 [Melampsora americana]|nr:hypothetical protein DFH28DRAFT_923180 [Melampsora americana]